MSLALSYFHLQLPCLTASFFRFLIDEDEETFKLELKEAFRMYDKVRLINKLHLRKNLQNCNGYITTEDLREILTELDPDLSRFHLSFKSQHFES